MTCPNSVFLELQQWYLELSDVFYGIGWLADVEFFTEDREHALGILWEPLLHTPLLKLLRIQNMEFWSSSGLSIILRELRVWYKARISIFIRVRSVVLDLMHFGSNLNILLSLFAGVWKSFIASSASFLRFILPFISFGSFCLNSVYSTID